MTTVIHGETEGGNACFQGRREGVENGSLDDVASVKALIADGALELLARGAGAHQDVPAGLAREVVTRGDGGFVDESGGRGREGGWEGGGGRDDGEVGLQALLTSASDED
jgi:hypothetical protein